jgi:hypothetical protein
MFQHTVMNYVETSAPAELTLVEWKASRPARDPAPPPPLRPAPSRSSSPRRREGLVADEHLVAGAQLPPAPALGLAVDADLLGGEQQLRLRRPSRRRPRA